MTVKSAHRVLLILEYFDQRESGASVKDISDAVRLPQSSTSYIMKTLLEAGYVRYQTTDRTYWPSPRIAILGKWLDRRYLADGHVRSLMMEIHNRTGYLVALGSPQPTALQVIDAIHPSGRSYFNARPGQLRPYTRTAMGKVLLSHKTDDVISRIHTKENLARGQDPKKTAYETLMRDIEIARRRGDAVCYSEFMEDVALFAVALPSSSEVPLALGIGGRVSDLRPRENTIMSMMHDLVGSYLPASPQV